MELVRADQRIFPLRGLVLLQNRHGLPFAIVDVKRWIRLNRAAHKALKLDVFAACDRFHALQELLETATREDVRLSLRTACEAAPKKLADLKDKGLLDVFLTPPDVTAPHLDAWFDAGREAGLPMRLQLHAPFPKDMDPTALADRIAKAGVAAVNVALADPFTERPPCRGKADSEATIGFMNAVVRALDARDVEANLLRVPFCLVEPHRWPHAVNQPQFFMDHQQYAKMPYLLAMRLYGRGPVIVSKYLQSMLRRETLSRTPEDERLLNWLNHHPAYYARMAFWRKVTKHLRIAGSVPKELDPSPEKYYRDAKRETRRRRKEMGSICAECRLRRICDHASDAFRRMLPDARISAVEGDELVVFPMHFAAEQRKYYDAIDAAHRDRDAQYFERAEEARLAVRKRPPDRQLSSQDYTVEHTFFETMEGGVRWHSALNCEKLSSALANLALPFTIAATFAGGTADYIGFSFDRTTKIVCPMEGLRHELILHVDANGRYVLLRDGVAVRPSEFEGARYVPLRLPDRVEPRLTIWNIDMSIVTHLVRIWEWNCEPVAAPKPKYSVIMVCTRYARRLQAALMALAHQRDFDVNRLEVIVGYVPGLDAVDDVIDSMRFSFPQLRILRSTFNEQKARAKGFMINESLKLASGEWVVLMDADAVLPPDMFARVEAIERDAHFIAPDGRKMLPPDLTAKVLVGEIRPWEQWDEIMKGPGEYRRREAGGVPIGFCQFVRKRCIDEVKYLEVDHFELSDMWFGIGIRKEFGPETWLTGVPVIHLDHGGSHWYGAASHR
ncbi:MAG TPA: glycosyltransferase [Candidatus Hydrogenedentes bacterium]|nr:glycosyltransferase [Candidatus Hydrogenedentota bacterium]HPG68787.1 glycosyltransferase [Candidatus Hydrogenedentota bacterium]